MSAPITKDWYLLRKNPKRIALLLLAVIGLMTVFLFQKVDALSFFGLEAHPYIHFAVKKVIRVVLNDTFMLVLIHAWFNQTGFTRLAWKVQVVDTLILLPLYLILKLCLEGDGEISSPLLSQLHRLIVNPTLMILLIPGAYFQQLRKNGNSY